MTKRAPLLLAVLAASALAAQPAPGPLLGLDADAIADVRTRLSAGDAELQPALAYLVAEAELAIAADYPTILDKELVPPSGDRQDFYSLAPYWWPNPDTDDGLPYVRRDGQVNPESRELDDQTLRNVLNAVPTLAWAWTFTGDDRYADKAGDLLRTWFADPATRMNPHLDYAQGVRGVSEGRMYGIIETARLAEMMDPLVVLKSSSALSDSDWASLDAWMGDFLVWLRTSEFGQGESSRLNNHATAYDAQVAALALYLGETETAREVLSAFPTRRIDAQIEPDGSQPEELQRTRSFSYSVFNLRWAFQAAQLAPTADVDLYGYASDDRRSLRAALDYLVPVVDGRDRWAHPQMNRYWPGALADLGALLRQAAIAYDEPAYEATRQRLDTDGTGRYLLLHPIR